MQIRAKFPVFSLKFRELSRGNRSIDCRHHQSITSYPETSTLLPEVVDISAACGTIVHREDAHLVSDQRKLELYRGLFSVGLQTGPFQRILMQKDAL